MGTRIDSRRVWTVEEVRRKLDGPLEVVIDGAVRYWLEVRIAGYDGQQPMVTANIGDGCFEEATFLWYSPVTGAWELSDGHQARVRALEAEDGVYVIALETTAVPTRHSSMPLTPCWRQ